MLRKSVYAKCSWLIKKSQIPFKVPIGITRHVIPNRALNINLPLDILAADWDIERKHQWLQDWEMKRMATNAIRY